MATGRVGQGPTPMLMLSLAQATMDHATMGHGAAPAAGSDGLWGFFSNLFGTDFMQRAQCVNQRPEIIWLHVIADGVIAAAYYSIPIALVWLVRQRRDLAFHWMFWLFAAFIFACG